MNISKEIFQIKVLLLSRLGMERGSHLCVLTPIGSKRKVEDPDEDDGGQIVMVRAWLTH